jgi:hypothetical protein
MSEETPMRKISRFTVPMILAIALYFAASWGLDALSAFTSPSYGLDDARAQFIFALGGVFGLGPVGLIKLAAFFAGVKLVAAIACAFHIADRFRTLAGGKADTRILEGGLITIALICFICIGAAGLSGNGAALRDQLIQFVLAALAIALCATERGAQPAEEVVAEEAVAGEEAPVLPAGAKWFAPWR